MDDDQALQIITRLKATIRTGHAPTISDEEFKWWDSKLRVLRTNMGASYSAHIDHLLKHLETARPHRRFSLDRVSAATALVAINEIIRGLENNRARGESCVEEGGFTKHEISK